ncbi:hypothetical protein HZA38_00415 [Candidatus Peregrinibacteria bacterium]|nr:hypothetical protein [Candidatus Peregrinibacteria bacterium]
MTRKPRFRGTILTLTLGILALFLLGAYKGASKKDSVDDSIELREELTSHLKPMALDIKIFDGIDEDENDAIVVDGTSLTSHRFDLEAYTEDKSYGGRGETARLSADTMRTIALPYKDQSEFWIIWSSPERIKKYALHVEMTLMVPPAKVEAEFVLSELGARLVTRRGFQFFTYEFSVWNGEEERFPLPEMDCED